MDGEFTRLPDLASRRMGGSVVAANDELFAAKEHLILPEAPVWSPATFGPRGQVYDGWETRRRREPATTTPSSAWACPGWSRGWWWTPPSSPATTPGGVGGGGRGRGLPVTG